MASFTMFPPTLPCQQQRLQQQQPTQLPLSCQTASTRACPSKSRLSLQTCEQSPPVRISSRTPLPTSHAYNLRSCPSFSPLSPSPSSSPTDASIHTPPPLSTLFSFSTDDDLLHNSFSYQDPTLKPPQANALGVQFNNPEQYNPTDFSLNWYGLPSDSPNPIQGLLNSDIYAKNNTAAAHHQSAHSFSSTPAPVVQQGSDDNYNDTDNSGQSTTNPIENTIFQQLQGFNLSNHLLNKKSKNMPSSTSSPQTPRDGTALYSSFGPSVTSGGAGMTKSAADFDFDMLAASFLNDQVAAFDSTSLASLAPATSNNNTNNSSKNITESFFANLPLIGSPVNFTSNLTSTSPPLQNAFRSFSSNAVNTMLPAQQLPRHNSSSSSSSVSSPALASPAFDASSAFPFGGLGASNNSPNFSGIDTPALVPDDGNDLAASLTTSPMWGQLDLGSISLFPQQQQTQTQSTMTAPLQQQASLPTISPKELSLPLPDKTFNNSNQVRPASSVAVNNNKANKKRVRESPAFGSDGEDEDEEEDEATQRQAQTTKKSRRSTSTSTSSAPQNHFTGTRHSASAALLPLDAPTQPRTYYGPESKTSKRAVPAAAARKVAAIKAQAEMMKRARRSVSSAAPAAAEEAEANAEVEDDDSGSLEGEVKEVIEMTIEQKRRQNTIAARRSRARKAEHLASLEESIRTLTERVNLLENEKMVWMMRAMAAGWTEDSRSNLVNLS